MCVHLDRVCVRRELMTGRSSHCSSGCLHSSQLTSSFSKRIIYRGACATDMNQCGPANELCATQSLHSEWLLLLSCVCVSVETEHLWMCLWGFVWVCAAHSEWMICSLDNRRSLPFHDVYRTRFGYMQNTGQASTSTVCSLWTLFREHRCWNLKPIHQSTYKLTGSKFKNVLTI